MEKKTGILNTFIRYGKLLFVFLKMSLMAQLEYRTNFAAGVLVETGWLLIKLLYVAVVYRAGIKIGVLTPDHILLFIGVYILLTGVYMLYYPNFTSLTTMIRDGKLDMYLVKPVAAQFLVTMAATGSVAACAGCGCGNRHDRDRLASGRTSRDGRLDRRLSLFPDLRRAPDLQPVFAAASSGVLDDGNERHRGSDGGSVGLQQHAAAHLRQVDAAYRNVSVAGVCHHELSGAVFDGRVVCSDGSLGRRCTSRILFDRTGGVESGSEELYIGKHIRSF